MLKYNNIVIKEYDMFEEIAVALDGSSEAEIVLPYAVAIGTAFKSKLTLVTATDSGSSDSCGTMLVYLNGLAEKLRQKNGGKNSLKIATEILTGKPAEAVLRFAEEKKADMVIIAGHGASGKNSPILGNIASKILSASNRPVLLVHTENRLDKYDGLIKRVLVPLDGSRMSESSLKTVAPVVSRLNAEVVLFQAIEPVRYVPGFETTVPNIILPSDDEIKNTAGRYLKEIEKALTQHHIKTSSIVIAATPASAIIDYADSHDIDMIAMTTHGYSGIKRWVFGSTTEKILQASNKPVLLIPSSNG
jgi:nucleotide-binding universal stress UspA family protein